MTSEDDINESIQFVMHFPDIEAEVKNAYVDVNDSFFNDNDNVALTYVEDLKSFAIIQKNNIKIFMKCMQQLYKDKNILCHEVNKISKTIESKTVYIFVLQQAKNGVIDDDNNDIDSMGELFDIKYLVSGEIYVFKSELMRNKIFNFIKTGEQKYMNNL